MSKFCTKGIYASGMVLQRLADNCVFGSAEADAEVTLSFDSIQESVKADSNGNWKIEFETGNAGGPYTMELKSKGETITFTDVYVGEVWVSSGQSNAELMMERLKYSYPEEITAPENPNIRMISVPITANFDDEQDSIQNPYWRSASPETICSMAGTGYFFAKKLSEDLKVPVGIINVAQGGSPITSWMSKQALEEIGNQEQALETLKKWQSAETRDKARAEQVEAQKKWDENLLKSDKGKSEHWENLSYEEIASKWQTVSIPSDVDILKSAGIVWFKKEIELTATQVEHFNAKGTNLWLGTIIDADCAYVNGTQVGITYYSYPPRRYSVPAGLLKEGKNTITLRVQKNSKYGVIRFYQQKPYYLFTADLQAEPSVCNSVEKVNGRIICGAQCKHVTEQDGSPSSIIQAEDSEFISLAGEWKMEVGCRVEDGPSNLFFEWMPTALYNGMLAPCFNYAIAGALWYQGESDAYDANRYKTLLLKMIMLWREKFAYAPSDMPFVIMQLPNWTDGNDVPFFSDSINWPAMRQTQLLVSEIAGNVGLAVTIDAGEWNDLHPEKKKTCGTRAAMEALRIAYNKPYNPSPKAIYTERKGNKVIVQFETGTASLKSSLLEIPGFYFLEDKGEEIKKVAAIGHIISDNEVEVIVPENAGKIIELRYLWADSPKQIVLYSTDDLPAAPFRAVIPE